jgi:hypothetical protein
MTSPYFCIFVIISPLMMAFCLYNFEFPLPKDNLNEV